MTRLEDWQVRLKEFLRGCIELKFQYGANDCALFAAGAVRAVTGIDLARGHRGYGTLTGGLRKVKAAGYEDHIEMVADLLPEISVASSVAGDVAIVEGVDGMSVAVVGGPKHLFAVSDDGLSRLPKSQAVRAFKVG